MENGAHNTRVIGGRIHPDNSIATTKQQSINGRCQNTLQVISRVIRLDAHTQNTIPAHGIAALGNNADL